MSAAPQLRALMYVTSLTSEIMDSMVGVENAIESALERQTTFQPVKSYLRNKSAADKRCEGEFYIICPQWLSVRVTWREHVGPSIYHFRNATSRWSAMSGQTFRPVSAVHAAWPLRRIICSPK